MCEHITCGSEPAREGARSGADDPAIFTRNRHYRRPRLAVRQMLRERRTPVLPRMLNPDKQGLLIRRKTDPGHFTAYRPDHEPADFTAHRVGAEHLVIAHAGKITGIARIAVSQNPQPSGLVEAQTVRAVE